METGLLRLSRKADIFHVMAGSMCDARTTDLILIWRKSGEAREPELLSLEVSATGGIWYGSGGGAAVAWPILRDVSANDVHLAGPASSDQAVPLHRPRIAAETNRKCRVNGPAR